MEKQPIEERGVSTEKIDSTSEIVEHPMDHVVSLSEPNDFAREKAMMELELLPGESRGYWKYHAPTKWIKQAKASGEINNDRDNLLYDTGAEISILDVAFACKIGCQIVKSEQKECIGIGEWCAFTGRAHSHQGHPK